MTTTTRCLCRDCGSDVIATGCGHEWYMVHDHVWAAAGGLPEPTLDDYLCVGCIENRLGRQLTPDDFTPAQVNDPNMQDAWSHRTPRLLARLVGQLELDL